MFRTFKSWRGGKGSSKASRTRKTRRVRLGVEVLEERDVPSAVYPNPNWSGYVAEPNNAQTQPVSAVSGTWIVPTVFGVTGAIPDKSSIWVGIDGMDGYLVQIGTEQDATVIRPGSYSASIEINEQGKSQSETTLTSITINPGDSISASIAYQGMTNGQESFSLSIIDNTNQQHWAGSETAGMAPRASAEWIVEATSNVVNPNLSVVQLLPEFQTGSNFGGVIFSAASATIGGVSGNINDPAWQNFGDNIILENWNGILRALSDGPDTQEDSTSALTPSGGFSVTNIYQPLTVIGSNVYDLDQGDLWQYNPSSGWLEIGAGVVAFAADGTDILMLSAPDSTTAGAPLFMTVTVMDAEGDLATGYTGTVSFSSSDLQAILPSTYTFTATNAGSHTFKVYLETAGSQTVTITDSYAFFNSMESQVQVAPGTATRFVMNPPNSATAGQWVWFNVTALDAYGNVATGYIGTVSFSSSDPRAEVLSGTYTFTAANQGIDEFAVTLFTGGSQTVTFTDSADGIDGQATIQVIPGAAFRFVLSAPSTTMVGVPLPMTVTAYDAFGNLATGYTGTVSFNSSDPQANLPPGYPFTAADQGRHTFKLTVNTAGSQTITVTDNANAISAQVNVLVKQPDPYVQSIIGATPNNSITSASSVTYTVTFSEDVFGVNASDFVLSATGTVASRSIQVTLVSGSMYTVTISGITGNGTLGLNLLDNGSIHDIAGDPLTQQNASASFQNQTTFATGSGPGDVATADLTGDGNTDLVVVNQGSNTVNVLLGNGNGTFQAQQTFAVGLDPRMVAVGDLTGNGIPDLVVDNFESNTVSVLLGNGNGTFQTQETYAVGNLPIAVAIGDVTGDGVPDLVVANLLSNSVSVLRGNGNGTFQAQTTIATGSRPYSMSVADVNGDGKPDLLVAYRNNNTVGVLLGNGNGSFQPPTTYAVGAGPISVTAADVNGDGNPDLIIINSFNNAGGNSISVLLGNGNGTFQAQTTFATGSEPDSVAVGDVNGDGKPDLIVSNYTSNNVSVLLGNGNGTFQAQQTFAAGTGAQSVALGDVTGNGRPDVIVANAGSSNSGDTVSVLLNTLNGNFTGQVYTIDQDAPPR